VKHLSGAPFYGRLLALPTNIRLDWKRNVSHKHSSLLRKFVKYGQKKFYNIGPRWVKELAYAIRPKEAAPTYVTTCAGAILSQP